MDGLTATRQNRPLIPDQLSREQEYNDNLAVECRNLLQVLSRKIEILCHEWSDDDDRVTRIRALAASVTTLNTLLNAGEQERMHPSGNGVFEDERGTEYRSVRNCDLEQWFSIK